MILGEDQRDFSWIDTYMKWQTKGVGRPPGPLRYGGPFLIDMFRSAMFLLLINPLIFEITK